MGCKRIEDIILTDYVDGNLKGESLRKVESHIAACAGCRRLAGEIVSAGKAIKKNSIKEPPPFVWERVREEIGREEPKRPFMFPRVAVTFAAAAALILFVLIAARFIPGNGAISTSIARDDIMAMSDIEEDWSEQDYGLGSSAEEYFL